MGVYRDILLTALYMRYIIDISPDIVDVIQSQINKGNYRTIQEFIITAIQNQIYLTDRPYTEAEDKIKSEIFSTLNNGRSTENLLALKSNSIMTVEPEPDRYFEKLSGFWNKFFPVKITIRILSNLLGDKNETVLLDELQEVASREARKIGLSLMRTEKVSGRKRGDRLFTGLPVNKNSERSRSRFKSHFIGEHRAKKIDGMPGTLRLLNIFAGNDGKNYVSLTQLGLEFSNLENPYIDNNVKNSVLSGEEKDLLLNIIKNNLPEEYNDIKNIMRLIYDGQNNTEKLLHSVKNFRPEFSHNEIQTYLSGHLNRMTDLGLLNRTYKGLSYSYEISENGYKILNEETEKSEKPPARGGK